MQLLLAVEAGFGRRRLARWEARVIDLDIIDYDGLVMPDKAWWLVAGEAETRALVLPHPRMHQRRFVLEPLGEILPNWVHPVLGSTAGELLDQLR